MGFEIVPLRLDATLRVIKKIGMEEFMAMLREILHATVHHEIPISTLKEIIERQLQEVR